MCLRTQTKKWNYTIKKDWKYTIKKDWKFHYKKGVEYTIKKRWSPRYCFKGAHIKQRGGNTL